MTDHTGKEPRERRPQDASTPHTQRRIASDTLFGAAGLVLIEHNGETYLLRKTRQGKLILTK